MFVYGQKDGRKSILTKLKQRMPIENKKARDNQQLDKDRLRRVGRHKHSFEIIKLFPVISSPQIWESVYIIGRKIFKRLQFKRKRTCIFSRKLFYFPGKLTLIYKRRKIDNKYED